MTTNPIHPATDPMLGSAFTTYTCPVHTDTEAELARVRRERNELRQRWKTVLVALGAKQDDTVAEVLEKIADTRARLAALRRILQDS